MPIFHKRHYEAMSDVIAKTMPRDTTVYAYSSIYDQWDMMRTEITNMFKVDSDKFDHVKFYAETRR